MFDIYLARDVDDFQADGTGRMFSGPNLTKIELYRTVSVKQESVKGVTQNIEEREIFSRLTIPTVALMEAFGMLIEQLGASGPMLDAAHEQFKEVLRNAIQKAASAKA
jgi:hypothetical protein